LRQLKTSSEVVAELQALTQRLPADGRRKAETNEVLHFKGADKAMVTLKSLGGAQYRGRAALAGGSYAVVLGTSRWRSDSPAGEYIVLLDGSDGAKPRLAYYNGTLESR